MKKLIRKFFYKLFPPILADLEKTKYLTGYNKSLMDVGPDVVIAANAKVYNLSHRKENIRVEGPGLIMGELCVFKYGGKIRIGKNCFIGEGSRIWSAESLTIGDDVLVSHNVNIMDTDAHEINAEQRAIDHVDFLKQGYSAKKGNILTSKIIIGNKAWIGFNAAILKGVTIGEGAIVAACSVVTKDVDAWTMVAGNPAKFVKSTN